MKYRRKSLKKRTYRKRKAFKKSGYRKSRYDNGISLKCHIVLDMLYYGAYVHADYSVDWGAQSLSGVNNTSRLADSQEFINYLARFREYKLSGVKIEFIPLMDVNSTGITAMSSLWSCHQLTTFPTAAMADNTFIGQDTFRVSNLNRAFKTYVNTGRYHKQKGEEWLAINLNYSNVAGTLLRLYAPGYVNGQIMGKVHTTYYVRFRGAVN